MKTIAEALAEMLPAFAPVGATRLPLADALGLFLAEPLVARRDLPPFDNSAMDGYAVRSADLAGAREGAPVAVPVSGESRAGSPPPSEPLAPGSALRIFTGAPMPPGADAVVMQEDTERDGDVVRIRVAPRPRDHVRHRGEDLREGAAMLAAGTRVGPGEIGLLASQGHATVSVFRRPRVAIVSTGDELRDVSDPADPGTIVNSNAYALAALVREAGCEPWVLPTAPDDLDTITERLREALRADVVLSSGGVSVGTYDLVHDAFVRAGITAEFWKVRIKPGKPLTFGRAGEVPVVGLPGNPVSAMVTFEVFVRPGLRKMLGDPAPHPATLAVELEAPHRRKAGRPELARAILRRDGARLLARMHPLQGSGSLPSMVGVDALVLLPEDRETFEAGEHLVALPLRDRIGSAASPFGKPR